MTVSQHDFPIVLPIPQEPLTSPLAPREADLRTCCWFDHDSEWPLDLDDVERAVVYHPECLGSEYHVTGHPDLSYARLLPTRYAQLVEIHRERQAERAKPRRRA